MILKRGWISLSLSISLLQPRAPATHGGPGPGPGAAGRPGVNFVAAAARPPIRSTSSFWISWLDRRLHRRSIYGSSRSLTPSDIDPSPSPSLGALG